MCENVRFFFREGNTVDGKNTAPVDMVIQYPIIMQSFIHPNGGCLGLFSINNNDIPRSSTLPTVPDLYSALCCPQAALHCQVRVVRGTSRKTRRTIKNTRDFWGVNKNTCRCWKWSLYLGYWPLPRMPVTTRIMKHFLVGQSRPKPLFASVTGKGPHPSYTMLCLHSIYLHIYRIIISTWLFDHTFLSVYELCNVPTN